MSRKGKINVAVGLSILIIATFLLVFQGSAVNSNGLNFSVSPDTVYFNWTFGPINITSLVNNSFFVVQNQNTSIGSQYFDQTKYSPGDYPGYDGPNSSLCFNGTTNKMSIVVQNSTGSYTNTTSVLNQTNSTFMNISAFQLCPPGFYNGTFNVALGGGTDLATLTARVNIPISSSNTFSEPSSNASVKGTLPANSTSIHKYYFNTSLAQNLTGVTINLTSDATTPMDLDLYLFNSSGSLLARSVENGSAKEEINANLPSAPDIWSFWIVGNVSTAQNYVAGMYFNTLNVSNANNPNQKISSINFGTLDAINNQSSQTNITLTNVDSNNFWNGVLQKSEIYRADAWANRSSAGDYYFMVPAFATKVKVMVDWTGGTRWTISLNDSNANFLGNSSGKFQTGNLTGTIEEENVLYAGAISASNDGLWKITVGNLTAVADNYNVTAQVWVDSSAWLNSSYPASGTNFNASSNSTNVTLRINLPLPNVANGNYSGFVNYYYPGQWNARIPIAFAVKSGSLIVNNSLFSDTENKFDNVGFARTGSSISYALPVNNTGDYDIYFTSSTSVNLTNQADSTRFMNLSVEWPANPIQHGANATLKVNITINTTNTGDVAGTYWGWALFNTTNSTNTSSSSYPFDSFYVYFNVFLWNNLTVNITGFTPTWIAAPINSTNMTFNISVSLANGTVISTNQLLNDTNFNAGLREGNSSLATPSLTGLVSSGSGVPFGFVCPTGYSVCILNGTLPSGVPGGTYNGTISVSLNTSTILGGTGAILIGTGVSSMQATVNDIGLKIADDPSDYSVGLYEGQIGIYTAYVKNYGTTAASPATITFTNSGSCPVTPLIYSTGSTCMGFLAGVNPTQNSTTAWNVNIPAYMTGDTNCTLKFKVTATAVTSDTMSCLMTISITSNTTKFGNGYFNVPVDVLVNATSGNNAGPAPGTQQSCTSNITCPDTQYCKSNVCTSLSCPTGWTAGSHKCSASSGTLTVTDYTSRIYVLQGSSNSSRVTVKNTGGVTYTVKLDVTTIFAGLTPSVSPSSYTLGGGNSGIYTVNFNVSSSAEIGPHTITIKTFANENTSLFTTKDITVIVLPLEETKAQINQTENDLKKAFANITAIFNSIAPNAEANYTIANRTYSRLLNILQDLESSIKSGDYVTANSLLNDANASLAEFRAQVTLLKNPAAGAGLLAPLGDFGGTLTLVAILVVIIVIGVFMAYLLLPAKKGFKPSIGFTPKAKVSFSQKLKHAFSKVNIAKPGQKSLVEFEKRPVLPSVQAAKPGEKKAYPEGYNKLDQFPLSYDKDKFKEKK
jgi:hypothetical protein